MGGHTLSVDRLTTLHVLTSIPAASQAMQVVKYSQNMYNGWKSDNQKHELIFKQASKNF